MVKEYEQFKIDEFIGDGLLAFIVRHLVCVNWATRVTQRIRATKMCSNEYLTAAAERIELTPFMFDHGDDNLDYACSEKKKLANAMEAKIYELFKKDGIDATINFVNLTIVHPYEILCNEMGRRRVQNKSLNDKGINI